MYTCCWQHGHHGIVLYEAINNHDDDDMLRMGICSAEVGRVQSSDFPKADALIEVL